MELLLFNIGELATLNYGDVSKPLSGIKMADREHLILPSGNAILISDGIIHKIAPQEEIMEEYVPDFSNEKSNLVNLMNVHGNAVIPGLVDCHTHLLWSGDRSNEMTMRQSGFSYKEISDKGGGISRTVSSTRKATKEQLISTGTKRVNQALTNGTTTLEAKSGYGLSVESEVKLLESSSEIKNVSCNLLPTWLGAHDFPKNKTQDEYMDELISEQLPIIVEKKLAKWVDVFCEPGWFSIEQTESIVTAAKELGLKSRLHVDEFVDSNGLSLAAELGSSSADHVGFSNLESREKAHRSGTMQVFLPGTPYVLGDNLGEGMKDCLENNWNFSLATDFNPNCQTLSLPFVASIATHRLGIDPLAALVACSRNPASSLNSELKSNVGSIYEGGPADINILKSKFVDYWCQTPGMSPIEKTLFSGNIV
ncbi:MAG: imidazolonepropionase [Candidatus Poseidoniales archaeon]|jgi:imidazolonepropionase|nr:imidazolonepropionase [Candidatus Poseidoniales archaeon]